MANAIVIDISHHNEDPIDWAKVKANGTVGVIFKATEGTGYTDPTYKSRNAAALAAGLCTSAYHYLKPGSITQQMQYFVKAVQPPKGSRLVIDYEDNGLKIADLETAVKALWDIAPDCEVTVYGANGFLGAQLAGKKNETLAKCSLWVASYTTASSPTVTNLKGTWPVWSLWQYTDKESVVGMVDPTVDCNRWNGPPSALPGWFLTNNVAPPTPAPEPTPTPEPVTSEVKVYVTVDTVVTGDVPVKVFVNGKPIG